MFETQQRRPSFSLSNSQASRVQPGQAILSHIEKALELQHQLAIAVIAVIHTDVAVIMNIINGVPSNYAQTVERLLNCEINELTIEKMKKVTSIADGVPSKVNTKALLATASDGQDGGQVE